MLIINDNFSRFLNGLTRQARFNQAVRLVGRRKNPVVVFQAEAREIERQAVNIRQRKRDFGDEREFFQHGFAHRVERVLHR